MAMKVESILEEKETEVAKISPEATIKRAAEWLRAKNVGALVVSSNDTVVGLISERDVVRAFAQYGEPVGSMQVKEIMTHGLITASPGDDVTHLMHLNDPPPRAPHPRASQRQAGWHCQHRRHS
jgi:CBS domain-containing protein